LAFASGSVYPLIPIYSPYAIFVTASHYAGDVEASASVHISCATHQDGKCIAAAKAIELSAPGSAEGIWFATYSYQIMYNGPVVSVTWSAEAVFAYSGGSIKITAGVSGGGLSGGAQIDIRPNVWTRKVRVAGTTSWVCECDDQT